MNRYTKFVGASIASALMISSAVGCAARTQSGPQAGAAATAEAVADDGSWVSQDFAYLANIKNVESVIASPAEYESVPWAVMLDAANSSTIIVAYLTNAACGKHLGTHVQESATSITLVSENERSDVKDCAKGATLAGGYFDLQAPLGDRTLYHAPVSDDWNTVATPIPVVPHTSEPVATPTAKAYSGSATCDNLLSDQTLAALAGAGLEEHSKDFSDSMASQPALTMFQFLDQGGFVCDWGGDRGARAFGYGPITADAAQAVLKHAESQEHVTVKTSDGVTRVVDRDGLFDYAVGDGYWALAIDNGGGDVLPSPTVSQIVDDVLANAPAF